jgi:hypothetical protein
MNKIQKKAVSIIAKVSPVVFQRTGQMLFLLIWPNLQETHKNVARQVLFHSETYGDIVVNASGTALHTKGFMVELEKMYDGELFEISQQ